MKFLPPLKVTPEISLEKEKVYFCELSALIQRLFRFMSFKRDNEKGIQLFFNLFIPLDHDFERKRIKTV